MCISNGAKPTLGWDLVLVKTPRAAGSIGFAWAEPFHPVTPINPPWGQLLTSCICLFGEAFLVLFSVVVIIYMTQLSVCLRNLLVIYKPGGPVNMFKDRLEAHNDLEKNWRNGLK